MPALFRIHNSILAIYGDAVAAKLALTFLFRIEEQQDPQSRRYREYNGNKTGWATALWHSALRRQGFDRGLRREDGTVADRLIGNVVVVFEDKTVPDRYNLAQSPAIVPTLESPSRETYREIDLIAEAERLFNT